MRGGEGRGDVSEGAGERRPSSGQSGETDD